MDALFEGVFKKLISPDFGKNLGGEFPLYIQPFPAECQGEIDGQVKRLSNRLTKKNFSCATINLYTLCMEILEAEGILETLLEEEKNIEKEDIHSTLDSVLDVKSVIIPRIKRVIESEAPDFLFIDGVGNVFPFIRSHSILNNIDELSQSSNIILFFPGEYDNLQLRLFGKIFDENYYRGHNLNDIN